VKGLKTLFKNTFFGCERVLNLFHKTCLIHCGKELLEKEEKL